MDMHLPEFTEVGTLGLARRQEDDRSTTKTLTTDQADHGTLKMMWSQVGTQASFGCNSEFNSQNTITE